MGASDAHFLWSYKLSVFPLPAYDAGTLAKVLPMLSAQMVESRNGSAEAVIVSCSDRLGIRLLPGGKPPCNGS